MAQGDALTTAVSTGTIEQSLSVPHDGRTSESACEEAVGDAVHLNDCAGAQDESRTPSTESEPEDTKTEKLPMDVGNSEGTDVPEQRHEDSKTSITNDEKPSVDGEENEPDESGWTHGRYRNSLLAAVGYLDLANALDFPANVWNAIPAPVYALVLMGLGGSIAILSVGFAIWDYQRSRRNVRFLKAERSWIQARLAKPAGLGPEAHLILQAWLDISFRELGWEVIDRILLDVSMGIAGILVGTGTLMAMRGDIPAVFRASNLMSGYIGNSLVVVYAFINLLWSIFMYNRARKHHHAIRNASKLSSPLRQAMIKHGRKHEWYAILNGLTVAVSSVGSMISATMWQGYVVLIPCVVSSVYCNFFWRKRLGYDREPARIWLHHGTFDIHASTQGIVDTKIDTSSKSRRSRAQFLDAVYEKRFLLELYGCYLAIAQRQPKCVHERTEKPET